MKTNRKMFLSLALITMSFMSQCFTKDVPSSITASGVQGVWNAIHGQSSPATELNRLKALCFLLEAKVDDTVIDGKCDEIFNNAQRRISQLIDEGMKEISAKDLKIDYTVYIKDVETMIKETGYKVAAGQVYVVHRALIYKLLNACKLVQMLLYHGELDASDTGKVDTYFAHILNLINEIPKGTKLDVLAEEFDKDVRAFRTYMKLADAKKDVFITKVKELLATLLKVAAQNPTRDTLSRCNELVATLKSIDESLVHMQQDATYTA